MQIFVYIFLYLSMTVLEYLKKDSLVNLEVLANRVWPGNSNARSYLSRKINGGRPFTDEDAAKIKSALLEILSEEISRVNRLPAR